MAFPTPSRLVAAAAVAALVILPACGGGGSSSAGGAGGGSGQSGSGNFGVTSANLSNDMYWEINRLIEIEFNNRLDPDSVSFDTVQFTSAEVTQPVTGSFEIKDDGVGKTLVFRPTCPTSPSNDNGGFVPGGFEYRLTIPTSSKFGASVIRDTEGRSLKEGFSRVFRTSEFAGSQLFVDYVDGPVQLIPANPVVWSEGLNFYSDPDSRIEINFNQAIDARPGNLNLQNLFILFADGEVGTASANVFPTDNILPGTLSVGRNCGESGSTVVFEISGLLPPNRNLKLVVKREFKDIAGQTNASDFSPALYRTPTLAEYFDDSATDWSTREVVDEFTDDFNSSANIDLASGLLFPSANIEKGFVQASFDFPGEFTTQDFYFDEQFSEIFTGGQTFFTDSSSTTFTVNNGVINCRDFTITAGSELRGRGSNPLVVYASGEVVIDGMLNVSGNHAVWPVGLNSCQRPEGGALGECGGGAGGTSSIEVNRETRRGGTGEGAFRVTGLGGQGGEGGINQETGVESASYNQNLINVISGGGGGGGFARTPSLSPHWYRYDADDKMQNIDRRHTADHDVAWNSATDVKLAGLRYAYVINGAEAGSRGSSWNCTEPDPTLPIGVLGMEDEKVDFILWWENDGTPADGGRPPSMAPLLRVSEPWDNAAGEPNPMTNDPSMTTVIDPVNPDGRMNGHPTDGPDGGQAGPAAFSTDGLTTNDFWGRRLNADGTVTVGELLVPWAGAGGGASGDMVIYNRGQNDTPLVDLYPDPNFPNGSIDVCRKGGPGGGGGGQVQILAIGNIKLGIESQILAEGGNGIGGESIGWTYGQISGSGGGSGGHVILSTASKLDLSELDPTDNTDEGDTNFSIADGTHYVIPIAGLNFAEAIRAVGGRRGWAGSRVQEIDHDGPLGNGEFEDGNDTYAIGRGGGGANGVVQIHVPDPATDILWPSNSSAAMLDYIHNGDVANNPADIDRVEEMMRILAAPSPFVLVPLFSARSMFQSKWVDTGLAELRQPNVGGLDFPNFSSSVLAMDGFSALDGMVNVNNESVVPLAPLLSGSQSNLALFQFEARIRNASVAFAGQKHFLNTPTLLVNHSFEPAAGSGLTYNIVSATYDKASDMLTLLTDPLDGSMEGGAGSSWNLRPRFFRLATSGSSDFVPDSASVVIEFQGAEESAAGSNEPGNPFPSATGWTSDLSTLEGYRFIRYRVLFDIGAGGSAVNLQSPRPALQYIKIPFTW